jgi:hypothetical protein
MTTPIINRLMDRCRRMYRPYWARQNAYEAALPVLLAATKAVR